MQHMHSTPNRIEIIEDNAIQLQPFEGTALEFSLNETTKTAYDV